MIYNNIPLILKTVNNKLIKLNILFINTNKLNNSLIKDYIDISIKGYEEENGNKETGYINHQQ